MRAASPYASVTDGPARIAGERASDASTDASTAGERASKAGTDASVAGEPLRVADPPASDASATASDANATESDASARATDADVPASKANSSPAKTYRARVARPVLLSPSAQGEGFVAPSKRPVIRGAMLAAARAWVLDHPALATALYASLFAARAFAVTRPVLLVNDGHMYFEMARNLGHGTLVLSNGLDVVDSPELWIENAVKRGPHLYPKYPPLHALIAAPRTSGAGY